MVTLFTGVDEASAWPTQADVASWGVQPVSHVFEFPFVVPDLAANWRPSAILVLV